jgi:hypothetical protein
MSKAHRAARLAQRIGWSAAYREVYGDPYEEFGNTPQEWAKKLRARGKSYRQIVNFVSLAFGHAYNLSTIFRWFETEEEYKRRLEYNAAWKRRKRDA